MTAQWLALAAAGERKARKRVTFIVQNNFKKRIDSQSSGHALLGCPYLICEYQQQLMIKIQILKDQERWLPQLTFEFLPTVPFQSHQFEGKVYLFDLL